MKRVVLVLLAAALVACATDSQAVVITSSAHPLLNNAKLVTFAEVPAPTPNPTISGVSFVGIAGMVHTNSETQLFPQPPYLVNSPTSAITSINGINFEIQFSTPVRAIGALFTAVNDDVTIEAFDGATSLGSTTIQQGLVSAAHFRGFGFESPVISKARVSVLNQDIILMDDFRFVIPEPSAISIGATSLCSLTLIRRRRFLRSPA
jgi:hypothetical protein